MPQMMPLNWLTLFFMFIIMLILLNIINYFNFNYSNLKFKINKVNSNYYWKW